MSPTTQFRSASLAARLLVLVAVPIVALSVLATQRVEAEQASARDAQTMVDIVELQQVVAQIYPYAQLEQIALEGLARIDEIGVPRGLVVSLSGVDLEAYYADNAAGFDAVLDALVTEHRNLVLLDGTLLGDRLGVVRGALQAQRDLSAERRAVSADVGAVFEDLGDLLHEVLDSADVPDDVSGDVRRNANQLDALGAVIASAGEYGQLVFQGILYRSEDELIDTYRAAARHEANITSFSHELDPARRQALEPLRAVLERVITAELPTPSADPARGATDPDNVASSAAIVLDLLDYLQALDEYSTEFHEAATSEAEVAAAEARTEAERTRQLLWGIAGVTAVLIGFVMYSILAPIRRLRGRARAISHGELDLDPLPLRGPRDIRSLTSTMNDMLSTLHRVSDEITRLASGDVDPNATLDLPGAIGISMRESVAHLARVTAQLQRSEQFSSAIVAQAADAIWTVDGDHVIRSANTASEELTGTSPAKQIGRSLRHFLSSTTGEATVLRPHGSQPKVLVATSEIDVDDERLTVVIAHDISERSQFEERLAYQAHHDALTGLPNRFAVLNHLEELARAERDVAVLFVDLDAFKSINDTQGHAVGDRVLADVGSRLLDAVRADEFVGRLGGDEFVVVMHDVAQTADVIALGHRIIREIEQPHRYGDQVFVLSASVGVAIPTPGTTALDTLRQADNAVYQAKARGRARVEIFDASMQERIDREAELELALRHAVRNNELVVHLQPLLDLATDRISGAEALVRWERPGHGLVPPNDFIPVAERSSLIFDIERWVLTHVCERLADWRQRDPRMHHRIAVNISGRHLIEGDLLADVDAALTLTGADPTLLELELTETHLLEDLDRATTILEALRDRGITIAVDDFGTGYSSMTYLRHLPIDTVKIDRSFVARATDHGYDSTVIEALLTIGRTLDLSVVAEGVETTEQLAYIRARGCHRAQGFLLAKPMPTTDAETIIFGNEDATHALAGTARSR